MAAARGQQRIQRRDDECLGSTGQNFHVLLYCFIEELEKEGRRKLTSSAPQCSLPHNLEKVRRIGGQPLLAVLVETPHIGHLTAMREHGTLRVTVEDLTDNATLTPVRKLLVLLFAFCSGHPAKGRLSEGSAQYFFLGFRF